MAVPLIGHFYSCGLSVLAFKRMWGWGWPCFDTNMNYIIKQEGLYQNKADSSLVCPCNCKMDNCFGTPTWRRCSHLNGGLVRYYLSWEVECEWMFPSTLQAITVCEGAAQNKNNAVDFCQSQWLTGEIPANGSSCSCQLTLIWLAHIT